VYSGLAMRVVILCESFAQDMGYLSAVLPKYLAREGADVHVVALDVPPYHRAPDFRGQVPAFVAAQALPAGTVRELDGFRVHILGHGWLGRFSYAKGLRRTLSAIQPDVVYSLGAIGPLPLQAALLAPELKYKLFTGNHTSAEMFPLARAAHPPLRERAQAFATRFVPGRLVSLVTERCYCRTAGCGEIASRYFGVQPSKICVVPLGVDTELFFVDRDDARRCQLRRQLGFEEHEIVCINTGRMVAHKNLQLLTTAIAELRGAGLPFAGLFLGDGPERANVAGQPGCVVRDFTPFRELPDYFRAADIAVWPAGESTSMLDAAACGLPLVVSERIDIHLDANGVAVRQDDGESLTRALAALADPIVRARLGSAGARLMHEHFGWEHAARVRMRHFEAAVARH
jgi:glycosyltransferase involved in cell wall biosynthesis